MLSTTMKTILTYGTYDLLHTGHIALLSWAKAKWDRLIVAISTDEFNAIKHKTASKPYEERKLILESIKYVDLVIPENNWEQKLQDVQEYDVDVFVMWGDREGEFDFVQEHCEVEYFPRIDGLSSTNIRNSIKDNWIKK